MLLAAAFLAAVLLISLLEGKTEKDRQRTRNDTREHSNETKALDVWSERRSMTVERDSKGEITSKIRSAIAATRRGKTDDLLHRKTDKK